MYQSISIETEEKYFTYYSENQSNLHMVNYVYGENVYGETRMCKPHLSSFSCIHLYELKLVKSH